MKQVFLSYARDDTTKARRLVRDLSADRRVRVWFDREEILSGMRWRPAIRKAIRESDFFIALLSRKSVSSRGVRHVELREALDVLDEFPDDQVFLIPARLDECPVPIVRMEELDYADLFPRWDEGLQRIRRSLGSAVAQQAAAAPPTTTATRSAGVTPAVGHHYRVALVDLDRRLGGLSRVARGLSRAQRLFGFTAAQCPTPRTARKTVDGAPQFYLDGVPPSFYAAIAPMNIDFAVCLTEAHIAFEKRGRIIPGYLASPSNQDERVMFVTWAGLRGYAREADVSFESAVAFLATGQLIAYFLDMDYHEKTRGCPMDFCEDLDDLVVGLRAGRFCPSCTRRLRRNPELHAAVDALIAWGRDRSRRAPLLATRLGKQR